MSFFVFRRHRGYGCVSMWAGPLGLHIYWPKFWYSQVDWCRNWLVVFSPDDE